MLLDRGCPLDVADAAGGDTVLHWAVRNANNELLAVLLRKGANPDLANRAGECPLHESLREGNLAGAQLLLRCGASVNQVKNLVTNDFVKKISRCRVLWALNLPLF